LTKSMRSGLRREVAKLNGFNLSFLVCLDLDVFNAAALAAALAFQSSIVRRSACFFFVDLLSTGVEAAFDSESLSVEEDEGDVMVKYFTLLMMIDEVNSGLGIVNFLVVNTMNVFGQLRRNMYQSSIEIYTKRVTPRDSIV
jgi:hypothetical protein